MRDPEACLTGGNRKYSKYTAVQYLLKIRIFKVILWNILNIPNLLNTLIFKIFHTKYFEYFDFQQVFNTVYFENQHFQPVKDGPV